MGGPRGDKNGRWRRGHYTHVKGYPRVTAGPLRGQFIHRIVATAKLGRPLKKDEDVHHLDGDKLNFHPDNLEVRGHREHGFVSAKQHFWVGKILEERQRQEWEDYFNEHEGKDDVRRKLRVR